MSFLGEASAERLDLDRSEIDYRRVFVSNPQLAGRRVSELHLREQFGALVTRVRRSDVEWLAHGDTVLELGDRVRVRKSSHHTRRVNTGCDDLRVVARRDAMDVISAFFGDSYRALSEIDVVTFSLGLALGAVVGLVPIPLPGGIVLRLGIAGGPLLVALILGAVERTGPLVWTIPYSANLTLRQIGLILFLAGVGTRAGYAFVSNLQNGGLMIFLGGALLTLNVATTTLWFGYRFLKIPMGTLVGMLAGLQTNPAVLSFALEQTDNDLPNVGYATVYPVATIAKILLAQVLLIVLR